MPLYMSGEGRDDLSGRKMVKYKHICDHFELRQAL
jgi:hypothetical protein